MFMQVVLFVLFAIYLWVQGFGVSCVQQLLATLTDANKMKRWLNNNVNIFYHYFCKKVDVQSTKHGGELVAEVLKSHGVKHLFTLSGGHIAPILTASEKCGIRIIDTRHEVTTVFAADATARLSGVPGVAVVTAGPGVTNTVTAVKNAQMAESALVLLGGAAASLLKGRGALQDIDQLSLFKPITKKTFSITRVRDIVPMLKEAFQTAQSGTPGPVFVELPIDVLYPYSIISKEIISSSKGGKGLAGKVVQWYLNNYLLNLFAGAWDEPADVKPLDVKIPFPTQANIQQAVQMISKAKRPLIILGSQSVLPPVGADNLRKAIEDIGIPVYLGGMSRGLLGRHSPIHMRQARREALAEADLVILGGTVTDFRLGYGRVISKKSKVIAVNRNHEQLTKNAGIFWNADLSIEGDAGKFFVEVSRSLKSSTFRVDGEWLGKLQSRDEEKEASAATMGESIPDEHLNPVHVLQKLDATLGDKTILVADGGDFVGTAAYVMRPRGPLCWLDPGAFGTLGVGAGFALGAKLCRPDHDVVIVFGDGSLGYSLIEFDTFTRMKLPVMAVVGNDACWTQIAREQKPMLGSDVACNLAYTSYEKAAEGLGAMGMALDAADRQRLEHAFKEAQQKLRSGSPILVNVLIGKTKFREGSISV